ncbi:AAA family ATPase [Bacillus sp. PS06]|uniref:AAA family ATPase n=1 Tax=Bacillus sp. PS06 TaxID=2764176 RepID=UPI00177B94C6|nr:AAA family ATPase [Bacillus sp. PS06]MBD8069126.1 AAA family ATPase [Bacillus sp. PS06]
MMIHYFIYSDKQMYSSAVKMMLDDLKIQSRIFDTLPDLRDEISDSKGTVMIIGPNSAQDPYDICQELSRMYPLTSVLLLLHKESIDLKQAMFSGAVDVVDIDSDESEVIKAIKKAEEVIRIKVKHDQEMNGIVREAKVITVCSTKGGVGKTTISVNIAAALNKHRLKVAVLDLDLQFGDVSLLFDLQPTQTIYDWVKQSYENGDKSYDRFLSKHPSGIDVLAAPSLPEFAELISGEHILYLIEAMKQEYDMIIIDTPPSFVETSLVALENSDVILLIASLDLPALKNGQLAIETLNLLGLEDKIKVVLNRDSKTERMSIELVENVLGRKIEASIPSDYHTVISSINKGESFVSGEPKTAVAKAVMKLTKQLISKMPSEIETRIEEPKKKGFSFFNRKKK